MAKKITSSQLQTVVTWVKNYVNANVSRNNLTDTQVDSILTSVFGGQYLPNDHVYKSGFASALYNATTWQVFGDSISTTYNISDTQIWHNSITADSEFSSMTKYNNSLTGSEISDGGRDIASFVERYTSLNANADLVTIFGGVNDWSHNFIPLGNYDDVTTSQSFYGALNTLLPGIKTRCPNARIIFMSPLKVQTGALSNYITDGKNTYGLTLQDYIQAIKYKCHQYNVEFVDLYGVTGLDPDVNTSNFQGDGLHPTASGHVALKDYLLNTATVSVPSDTYEETPEEPTPATNTVTVNGLHNNSHFNLFYAIDASNLSSGDVVTVTWNYSNASDGVTGFNNSASFFSESYADAIRSDTSTGVTYACDISQGGTLASGTSTSTINVTNSNNYPYFLAMTSFGAIGGSAPITWHIDNISVTVNGSEVPILGAGGFFTDESITVDYNFASSGGGSEITDTHVTEGLSLYLDSANASNTTNTLVDMSGNGNNFTCSGDIALNDANRVTLNGIYFSNTSYQPHTTTDNDFTFEFFGDIESTSARNYFFSYGSRNGFSWDEQYGVSGQLGSGDYIFTGTNTVNGNANRIAPTFGEKHIILTKNGTTMSIYVDGQLLGSLEYTTSWSASYTNFRLFVRYNTSNQLRGAMKYVRWYTKGFTAEEVTQNYNSRNN